MALKRKNGFWWVELTYCGERIRKSTKTKVKADAQCFHDQLLEELWKTKKIRTVPKKTWVDAVVRWIDESSHKRSLDTDKFHLAWLDPYFRNKLLKDITEELIEKVAHEREKTGVKLSSVNRVLEVIRAILNRAHKEWKWLDSVPTIRMRKFENKRLRWLTQKEAQRLLDELPPHLKDMAAFTLATGLRESNVTGLQWSVVNLAKNHALIHSDQSKTKRAIPVPLNSLAQDIVAKQKGKHPIYVFTYQVTIYRKPQNESRARFRHWYLVPKARGPLKPLLHMVRPEGFEPPTLWFVAKYSIQLSYGRIFCVAEREGFEPSMRFCPILP